MEYFVFEQQVLFRVDMRTVTSNQGGILYANRKNIDLGIYMPLRLLYRFQRYKSRQLQSPMAVKLLLNNTRVVLHIEI